MITPEKQQQFDAILDEMESHSNEMLQAKGISNEELNAVMTLPVSAMALKLGVLKKIDEEEAQILIAAVAICRVKINELQAEIATLKAAK